MPVHLHLKGDCALIIDGFQVIDDLSPINRSVKGQQMCVLITVVVIQMQGKKPVSVSLKNINFRVKAVIMTAVLAEAQPL